MYFYIVCACLFLHHLLVCLLYKQSEKSIQNYLILIFYFVYAIHIALYLQNKPVNISENVLMFEMSFQQFDIF